MKALLERLRAGDTMDASAAEAVMDVLATEDVEAADVTELLTTLRDRGETVDEVAGFARSLRRRALRPSIPGAEDAADTCGTGGDGASSLNLSTAAALLAAACGVPIVKHGNRSISSRSGSADVLEALGITLPTGDVAAASCFAKTGFTFLFAPRHHPALARVMPVRRAIGRSVFNLLGPLVSPVTPRFQVAGAYSLDAARVMAGALARLGVERALVVHGAHGWDEATPLGPFVAIDVRDGACVESVRDPLDLGIARCAAAPLRGGDATGNARRLRAVLEGTEHGAHRDAVVLNTALVLEVTGRAASARDGVSIAREALDRGEGEHVLWRLLQACPRTPTPSKGVARV